MKNTHKKKKLKYFSNIYRNQNKQKSKVKAKKKAKMGLKMSKDKKMILNAVEKCKHSLEVCHQKYMLSVGKDRELYYRRIDYAQGLKVYYEQLEKELICDVPVRFEIRREPFGITLVITKGSIKVKEFVNYSPYYLSCDNRDKTPISEQMEIPPFLKRYAQYS